MLKRITDLTLTELKCLCVLNTCDTCPVGCKKREVATVKVLDEEYDTNSIKYPVRVGDVLEVQKIECDPDSNQCEACDFALILFEGIRVCIFDLGYILAGDSLSRLKNLIVMLPNKVIEKLELTDKVVTEDAPSWLYRRTDRKEEESDSSICEAHSE